MSNRTELLQSILFRRRLAGGGIAAVALLGVAGAIAVWHVQAGRTEDMARRLTGGDARQAPALIRRYGCGGCHTVPGVAAADGQVAPPLAGLRQRVYIGGVLRNTGDNLVRWIVDPQDFSPHSAMPPTGINEREARDVAAYLYTR